MEIRLSLQSYQSRSVPMSAQKVVNMYAEKGPDGGKTDFVLFGTPGLTSFSDLETGDVNNMVSVSGKLYAVGEEFFYQIDSDGIVTQKGIFIGLSGHVSISVNNEFIVIIDELGIGYTYNTTTDAFLKIIDADFPTATNSVFLGQYTIVGSQDTGQFFWSSLADPTIWDALDFATAEGSPDNIVAVASVNSELWLIGEKTTEVWALTGDSQAPFARTGSAYIQKGCLSKNSIKAQDNSLYWLSDERTIVRNRGYSLEKISTFAIDDEINSFDVIEDAIGSVYAQEGHDFYVLTFPTEKRTFVFDIVTGLWHERESSDDARWLVNTIIEFNNFVYGGDYKTGNIYKIDLNVYTEAGNIIKRSNTFPNLFLDDKRGIFHKLRVDLESGKGLESNVDPKIVMDYSDDGGQTFGSETSVSMGKIGEYLTRAVFYRLGQGRQRVFRIKFYDPIKISVLGCYAEISVEGS